MKRANSPKVIEAIKTLVSERELTKKDFSDKTIFNLAAKMSQNEMAALLSISQPSVHARLKGMSAGAEDGEEAKDFTEKPLTDREVMKQLRDNLVKQALISRGKEQRDAITSLVRVIERAQKADLTDETEKTRLLFDYLSRDFLIDVCFLIHRSGVHVDAPYLFSAAFKKAQEISRTGVVPEDQQNQFNIAVEEAKRRGEEKYRNSFEYISEHGLSGGFGGPDSHFEKREDGYYYDKETGKRLNL